MLLLSAAAERSPLKAYGTKVKTAGYKAYVLLGNPTYIGTLLKLLALTEDYFTMKR